jgi:hypothetical protein
VGFHPPPPPLCTHTYVAALKAPKKASAVPLWCPKGTARQAAARVYPRAVPVPSRARTRARINTHAPHARTHCVTLRLPRVLKLFRLIRLARLSRLDQLLSRLSDYISGGVVPFLAYPPTVRTRSRTCFR